LCGDLKQALADFDKAIVLDPKNDLAYRDRGEVYLMTGELGKAQTDFAKAKSLDPSITIPNIDSTR